MKSMTRFFSLSVPVVLLVIVFYRTVFSAGPLRLQVILTDLAEFEIDFDAFRRFANYFASFEWVPFYGFSFDQSLSIGEQILAFLREFLDPFGLTIEFWDSIFDFVKSIVLSAVYAFKMLVEILGIPDIFPDISFNGGGHRGGR